MKAGLNPHRKGFAAVYRRRQDINFIIHTTRSMLPWPVSWGWIRYTGYSVPPLASGLFAAYGCPVRKHRNITPLRRWNDQPEGVSPQSRRPCPADDVKFSRASALEEVCAGLIERRQAVKEKPCMERVKESLVTQLARASTPPAGKPKPLYNSERAGDVISPRCCGSRFSFGAGRGGLRSTSPEPLHGKQGFRRRRKYTAGFISAFEIATRSFIQPPRYIYRFPAGQKVLPLLDDFAQLIGTSVYTVEMDAIEAAAVKIARN